MSGETILIEQLRADVERLRDDRADLQERCNRLSAEKAEALRMLAEAERERDAYKRAKEGNDERFMRERDEARDERDARPDISAEDAALHAGAVTFSESIGASQRIHSALRAHAAKAVKPNPTDCPKCGRHDGGLIALGLAELCSSGCHYAQKAVKP